jgi:hypothetical protein
MVEGVRKSDAMDRRRATIEGPNDGCFP